jgi:hypothetical protein
VTDHDSLAAALAGFQAELPRVRKDNQGVINAKDGKQGYKYMYADLADVSLVVMPLLGKHGLSFSTKPTMVDGRFVLEYVLRHTSGESDGGQWPLSVGTPQQMGSAITYARRYALSAITGVAPDDADDDGVAAAAVSHRAAERVERPAEPSREQLLLRARAYLAHTCRENEWDLDLVAARFTAQHDGMTLASCQDPELITKFRDGLFGVSASVLRPKKDPKAEDKPRPAAPGTTPESEWTMPV